MAGKGKAVGAAIKYGPIVYEASRRYGPKVLDQLKAGLEPGEQDMQAKVDKGNQHKKAVQHASTVINGSTLQVFYRNAPHWIVFSGEEPIAVHPRASAPYAELLKNVDLLKRIRPQDEPTALQRLRSATRKKSPQPGAPSPGTTRSSPSRHARAEVRVRPSDTTGNQTVTPSSGDSSSDTFSTNTSSPDSVSSEGPNSGDTPDRD